MSLHTGARLGAYEVLSSIGRGGMGQVYRARHLKLGREVAIKVLPQEVAADRERLARFEREARLASSLNHPNIITIHDVAEHDGTTYIAMELVEGRTLRQLISDASLPIERAIAIAIQVADGLAKAHAAGIVHRDLKPENIMVTDDGVAKILDFGIAKALSHSGEVETSAATMKETTAENVIVGTPRYMSPEQLARGAVDHRSDQFAFGIVLYEMLSGRPPFDGPSLASIITAISHDPPPPLKPIRPDVPPDLLRVVNRCLQKKPEDRYEQTAEVCRELREIERRRARGAGTILLRPAFVAAALGVLVLLGAIGAWNWFRGAERRWAETRAVPEISSHIDAGNLFEAYRLGIRAKKSVDADPERDQLLERITIPLPVSSDPPGATVSIRSYDAPDSPWEVLGTTPLQARVPYALMRWKIEKEGFETFEGAPFSGPALGMLAMGLKLEPAGARPPGTVRVPAGPFRGGPHRLILPNGQHEVLLGDYWIDRFETTNREFKEFVDAGGYRDPSFWTDPFLENGTELDRPEAMARFRDATGRPGPATWSLGTYPEESDELPVGGVSWHEAAAYCRFRGKTLPTIYHWFKAGGQEQLSGILRLSNFAGEGPAAAGTHQGLGGYGTYDAAGNVKEWTWNATESRGMRYLLGGAWNDPTYMYRHLEARPPFERLPTHGIRCAVYGEPPEPVLLEPIDPNLTIPNRPPVSDEIFDAYRGMYAYDPSPLEAEIESVDDTSPHWRKEVVSFRTAYGDERMRALIFLPHNAAPPYRAVLWFPGDDVFIFRSSETLASSYLFDFIPRSGRALVYPIYHGMYERFAPVDFSKPNEWRDRLIVWSKDLGRTIDYLETRSDIDSDSLAYYGFSSGAVYGPVLAAVDPRIRATILLAAGITPREVRPEMDLNHFAPRATVPTLMINGIDDFIMPYDLSQKPLFELLGTDPAEKRHARLQGGHIPSDRLGMIREILDFLDRHAGAVNAGSKRVASSE